jgi:hypothetical protein
MDREEKMPRVTPTRSDALRLVVYHAGVGLGGVEVSLATLLRHLNPTIDVLLIGTEPSVTKYRRGPEQVGLSRNAESPADDP